MRTGRIAQIWTEGNLPIIREMIWDSIDLINLDPPFGSKTIYDAPIGSNAAEGDLRIQGYYCTSRLRGSTSSKLGFLG